MRKAGDVKNLSTCFNTLVTSRLQFVNTSIIEAGTIGSS